MLAYQHGYLANRATTEARRAALARAGNTPLLRPQNVFTA